MSRILLEVPQRDRDLAPEADDFLTEEKLDSLWEWFCVGNLNNIHPQVIFAKLINAARKPYRERLLLAHDHATCTPGGSDTLGESTAIPEVQQQPQHSEHRTPIEKLPTNLAISDDSLQTNQMTIAKLQTKLAISDDSLQTKQMMINHMKDTLQMKETIIKQLEERVNHMDLLQGQEGKKIQEHQESNQKIASEKKQLEKDLEEMRVKYETFRPIQVMLKSPHFDKFISVRNGKASATSKSGPDETFTIVKHPNGMFSFQTNSLPVAYLSLTDSLGFTSSETCGSREKFWLQNSGEAATYIESVHFPGRFLTALVSDSGLLCWKGGKVPESSIYIIVC